MVKLLEENIGMNLHDLELGKHINMTPTAQVIIGKNDNCTLSKLNTFAFQKILVQTIKDRTHIGRKYLQII